MSCLRAVHAPEELGGCSGVVIDWCKGHGYWFDTHELQKIVEFVNAGGLDKARERELARAKDQVRRANEQKKTMATSMGTGAYDAGFRGPPYEASGIDDIVQLLSSLVRGIFGRPRL